ncbi:hypothetical protein PHLCEN_2v9848 [Hermanssonia centrifuga]|uniref:Uncharacterized protein n=1 Tax=Hermanssonia centrifuga TaxID=98765 RepID=A0A2R6NPN7_9APHY|nr:hypothetical protein PHLCEN_2v9848 [Hermanssonia centrifuga]
MNSILSNLKRRSRSRTKPDFTSPSKAKPLDILPGLSEEDEGRPSLSSISSSSSHLSPTYCASRSAGGSSTFDARSTQDVQDRKRDSRRVVLTGVEGLTFDDFFPLYNEPPRPAPSPPAPKSTVSPPRRTFSSTSIVCDSPLNSIEFRFSGLDLPFDFPSPPSTINTHRSPSPTPSFSSSRTTSTISSSASSRSKNGPSTPPTSDDESHCVPNSKPCLPGAPAHKAHRASMVYMKSMPDLPRLSHLPDHDDEENVSDEEDASWYAQDISDIITLSTPLPPTFPLTPTSTVDSRVRPDSLPPPPRFNSAGRSRHSKPLPVVPRLSIQPSPPRGPSAQLDPTFPAQKKRHPAIPSRAPPPPPIRIECPSPTMEEKTDELLALLANAALDSGFSGTGLGGSSNVFPPSLPVTPSSAYIPMTPAPSRPPPRSSIPADVDDLEEGNRSAEQQDQDLAQTVEFELEGASSPEWPATPHSISLYSQASFSIDALPSSPSSPFEFQFEMPSVEGQDEDSLSPAIPDSPLVGMYASNAPERVLRSRWSTSTLSSLVDSRQVPQSASSWMPRFNLGSSSPSKKAKSKTSSGRPNLKSVVRTPLSPTFKKSVDLERRDSHSSRMSDCGSDSGDSTSSSGLRRKPIPIEIFMRS